MIHQLNDTSKVIHLFAGWEETIIDSCLQKIMGKVYVTDLEDPQSAIASLGCFVFLAGIPNSELLKAKPEGFAIMTYLDHQWEACIQACFPQAKKVTRYAIKKKTVFDTAYLEKLVKDLPKGYALREIDGEIYDLCLKNSQMMDFVSSFQSQDDYVRNGRGFVIMKDGQIVSGASSYSRSRQAIEIEVDTITGERRKGLASIACAALILKCLEEGLYPSWDAQNMNSVRLAEKLGYEVDHAYPAYELSDYESDMN